MGTGLVEGLTPQPAGLLLVTYLFREYQVPSDQPPNIDDPALMHTIIYYIAAEYDEEGTKKATISSTQRAQVLHQNLMNAAANDSMSLLSRVISRKVDKCSQGQVSVLQTL